MKCKYECVNKECKDCYLEYRLNNQIEWHKCKANSYKLNYNRIVMVTLIISCLLPVLASVNFKFILNSKTYLTIFCTINSILISINKFFDLKELWISYRSVHLLLEKEKIKFIEKQEPYNKSLKEDNLNCLIFIVEGLLDKQNFSWKKMIRSNNNISTSKNIKKKEDDH